MKTINYMNDDLIKTELLFPKIFSNYEERDWGVLFCNENNKTSHDSNHCVIFGSNITDLILEEIKSFYQEKQITPRIYHPFINGYLHKNRDILIRHGFKIEVNNSDQCMILTNKSQIKSSNQLNIKCLNSWDERIVHDILIPNQSEYEIDLLKNAIKNKHFKLFLGYKNHQAVTMASLLYYSDTNCVRLDHVQTAVTYRNQGFSKELIDFLVNYHEENSNATLYLSVENLVAQKIYQNAGFSLSKTHFESWTAFYDGKI